MAKGLRVLGTMTGVQQTKENIKVAAENFVTKFPVYNKL